VGTNWGKTQEFTMPVFTDKTVQNLKTVGRYTDPTTSGLNLQVKKGGKQYWTFRFLLDGKRHDIGLGVYPTVSLKEARQRATSVRNDLNHGSDAANTMETR